MHSNGVLGSAGMTRRIMGLGMMGLWAGRRCIACCEYGFGMDSFLFWEGSVIIDNGSGVNMCRTRQTQSISVPDFIG